MHLRASQIPKRKKSSDLKLQPAEKSESEDNETETEKYEIRDDRSKHFVFRILPVGLLSKFCSREQSDCAGTEWESRAAAARRTSK
jgi:hypothetical protein